MRSPRPQRRRQKSVDPAAQRFQGLVLERALEHPPDARQMRQVVGLAVAPQQANEQADDARMPLRRHQGEAGAEILGRQAGGREVARQAGAMDGGRHVPPRVLDQRDQVVGGMAALGVLKVEQAASAHARSIGQPQEIVLVIVAQQQRAGVGRQRRQAGAPGGTVAFGLVVACRLTGCFR
jgi:hypothetical protein